MIYKFLFFLLVFIFFRPGYTQKTLINPHGTDFELSCETCHTTSDWYNIPNWKFNHDQTGFSLFGAHKKAECSACHQSLVFNQIGVSCLDCHTDIHKSDLGNECENCHNSQSWENRSEIMDQHSQTDFPLIGVHANLDCESCHIDELQRQFSTLSVECQSCHLIDYMKTINPSHQKADFNLDCQDCHLQVTANWKTSAFEHPATFILSGAHTRVECVDCHAVEYDGTSSVCSGCHMADFENSVNPDHSSFGFPTVCEECHNDISWERALFDHLAESGFAVEGAHQSILCTDCHINNQLSGLPQDCIGCHQNDFNLASEPNHIENAFSEDCLECHSVNSWEPATFDHFGTQFPLTGAHININCSDCHTNGYIEQLPTDCFSCHELDFTTVSDPNHISNNFDHDCLLCHSTAAWTPATFNHVNTQFPLTGAHVGIDCSICHSDGYQNTPLQCVACHQAEFDETTQPNHINAQFPTTCETCHTTVDWEPSTWDHDGQYFPIYTGAHREEWNDCIDCHLNTSNYSQFECITCHEHNQQDMDDDHKEEPGYEYNSIKCYECHPNGKS